MQIYSTVTVDISTVEHRGYLSLHLKITVDSCSTYTCNSFHIFSSRSLLLSPVRLSVCRLSVTFVTLLSRLKYWAIFRHLVHWPSLDIHGKLYGDRPRVTPPSGGLNARGVAKYSDFSLLECCISEMVHDRR